MDIQTIVNDEALRRQEFPVVRERVFMAHAGVCNLPRVAAEAIRRYAEDAEFHRQETPWALQRAEDAREAAAQLIGAKSTEISLLGPTSLGISLVANGIDWKPGDEVVYYHDDYPANVYPWSHLEAKGVKPVPLHTDEPGVITWDTIEKVISSKTRLVALASCNFLSGYRIDHDTIGRNLHERGILFSLDAIQTVGAFPTSVEHVDFLSADSHKWMLGPATAGIFYVSEDARDLLEPSLLGSFNVISPDFVAQDEIKYYAGGRRYEPGMLNFLGIVGMAASLDLLTKFGSDAIAARLLELRRVLVEGLRPLGYRLYIEEVDHDPATPDASRTAIVTVTHPDRHMEPLFEKLEENHVVASLRKNRAGEAFIRFSPHVYNTMDEVDKIVDLMR